MTVYQEEPFSAGTLIDATRGHFTTPRELFHVEDLAAAGWRTL